MANKIVAVLAVHNEEAYLPYTLKPLKSCTDNIVAVLDNCSDQSIELLDGVTKLCLLSHSWVNVRAETKHVGMTHAKPLGDYILVTDADLLLDTYSVRKAQHILDTQNADVVVFTYKQYSLYGSVLCRVKDEVLNLFGKLTKRFTRQPVRTGTYLIRSDKASMGDVTSDYESLLPKLDTTFLETGFKHLRPRYSGRVQVTMGMCRATLESYNLFKVVVYSLCTFSPLVLAGFLSKRLNMQYNMEY